MPGIDKNRYIIRPKGLFFLFLVWKSKALPRTETLDLSRLDEDDDRENKELVFEYRPTPVV